MSLVYQKEVRKYYIYHYRVLAKSLTFRNLIERKTMKRIRGYASSYKKSILFRDISIEIRLFEIKPPTHIPKRKRKVNCCLHNPEKLLQPCEIWDL